MFYLPVVAPSKRSFKVLPKKTMNWHANIIIGLKNNICSNWEIQLSSCQRRPFHPASDTSLEDNNWMRKFPLSDNIFCSILFQMRLLFSSWSFAPESLEAMCPCRELLVSWCTNTSRSADFCMTPQISKDYSINLTGWDFIWGVTTPLNTCYFRFIYDPCRQKNVYYRRNWDQSWKLCVVATTKNGRNHLSIPRVLQMELRKIISHTYKQIMRH